MSEGRRNQRRQSRRPEALRGAEGQASLERLPRTMPLSPRAWGSIPVGEGDFRSWDADLASYWRILKARRWTVVSIFALVALAVFIGTSIQPRLYKATALLEIGKENPDVPTVEALFKLAGVSADYLETQFGILRSETLAGRVIEELQLATLEEFNPPKSWASSTPEEATTSKDGTYQSVLKRFQARLSVVPLKGTRLVSVSFESQDPHLAARVVNSLCANYAAMRHETGERTAKWLSVQLESTRAKLEKSEAELLDYARKHGLVFLDQSGGGTENLLDDRLRQTQQELSRAEGARYEKESIYRLVQKGDLESLPGVVENKLLQDLTVRLADLRREHAQLATTFTPDYPKVKQVQNQIREVEAILAGEQRKVVDRVANDYTAAVQREELLRKAFSNLQGHANQTAEKASRYGLLKREVETNRQLYEVLQRQVKEAGISAGLKATNVGVVDFATPPRDPYKPNLRLNLAIGLMAGVILGVAGAFIREYLDTSVRNPEEIEGFLDVPTLAMIPAVKLLNGAEDHTSKGLIHRGLSRLRNLPAQEAQVSHWYRIDEEGENQQALLEAFGALRTAVLLETRQPAPRSLLVTSTQPREGKTTVAVNLALSLAQLGRRMLLIDADLRRPSIHRALELPNRHGLGDLLTENSVDWRSVVQAGVVPGLDVMTSGRPVSNPTAVLLSWATREMMNQLLVEYDFVIIDAPALLVNVADARILSNLAEGVVMVIRTGMTSRAAVERARGAVTNLVGVIINDVDYQLLPSYYMSYYGCERHRPHSV